MHRVVISAFYTLMLSSAFLTVGDGMLLAGAVSGLHAVESHVRNGLSGLDGAGFAGVRDWHPALVRTAQGSAKVSPLSIPAMISILRETGEESVLENAVARELGIPLKNGEKDIEMKGRAFSNGKVMRIALIPVDSARAYVTLVVDSESQIEFYLTTAAGRLEKALLNTAIDGALREMPMPQAENRFRDELSFWQSKLGPAPVADP